MTAGRYDVIVVGGGHNGLVAAAFFAKAGARTILLERRSKAGGAADTSAPWPDHPDFHVTTYSYVASLLPPSIVRALELTRFGYQVTPIGPHYQAYADGRSLSLYRGDPRRSAESIARFSKKDAEAMPAWNAWLDGVAAVLGPLLMTVPPALGSKRPRDLLDLLRAAWRARGLDARGVGDATRLFTMSIRDLLDDWFESEQVKGMITGSGVIGAWAGPSWPGTAYVMLHHSIGDAGDGKIGSWGAPRGGMGGLSDSIRRSAEAFGAQVRVGAQVAHILVRDRRAHGVVLQSGEELHAPIVVSTIHPSVAFLELVDRTDLPADFARDIERWKSRSGTVKVNLAVSELPSFAADPGTQVQEHHTGFIELGPSPDYVQRAFDDAVAGRAAKQPFVDGFIPTVFDPSLMPAGVHNVSLFTQWVPHQWSAKPHRAELEAYADRIVAAFDELAPNFARSVIARQVLGPYDIDHELGMVGGNIFHGELSVEQLFHMRPAPGYADYRTPIRGLYHGSSATHAGGGVTGIPGWQAYRQAMKDTRRARRRRSRAQSAT